MEGKGFPKQLLVQPVMGVNSLAAGLPVVKDGFPHSCLCSSGGHGSGASLLEGGWVPAHLSDHLCEGM